MLANAACSCVDADRRGRRLLLDAGRAAAWSISDVDSIRFEVVVLSAVIWSSTSFWLASAWATMTAVRSAEIVVVVARSTPLISSMLFLWMRSIAR